MSTGSDRSERLLNLLDKAWDAKSVGGYSNVIEAARAYLFVTEDQAELSPDIPAVTETDPRLDRQIARIQSYLDREADQAENDNQATGVIHAQLTLLPSGHIAEANSAAYQRFGPKLLTLKDLNLDYASHNRLSHMLSRLGQGISPEDHIQHLTSDNDGSPMFGLCHIVSVEHHGAITRAMRLSLTHVVWTPRVLEHLAAAMDLTTSESEILGGLLSGATQREIAEDRDRSVDTVKAQVKSILRKASASKTPELVQLCTGMAFILKVSERSGEVITEAPKPEDLKVKQSLALPDGRRLSFYVYGAEFGRPVMFIHGQMQGPFFTPALIDSLKASNITLYCPSRPGFGETSQPASDKEFDTVTISDALALFKHINAPSISIVALQGGVSHAFRIAKALNGACRSMVMVDAGIPIEEAYISSMERQTQFAAYAVKYAPSVLNLVTRIAIATHRNNKLGFLKKLYADAPLDLATLEEPELLDVQERGAEHVIIQGPKAFINDGCSAMSNWADDFAACQHIPQYWLHPSDCPIMKAEFVSAYVTERTKHTVEIVPRSGYTILHTHSAIFIATLNRLIGN